MKKVMYTVICFCIAFSVSIDIALKANAEVNMSNKGVIFVNNVEIDPVDSVIVNDNEMFIPLRTILEALGSTIIWEASTGNVYFDYAGVVYVCKFVALNFNFPEDKNILVCNVRNINSEKFVDHIPLNPMGASGFYCIINERTYLYQQTGQRLLEALGCRVEIDLEQNRLSIEA